jgi:hypothetical protein
MATVEDMDRVNSFFISGGGKVDELTMQSWKRLLKLVEEKFASTNKQITPVCPNFATLPIYNEDSGEVNQLHVCKSEGKP